MPQPSPKVGDIWKYKTIDLWNGKELFTSQIDYAALDGDRRVFRGSSSVNPEIRTFFQSFDGNSCRTMRGDDKFICSGAFKFPADKGIQYEYKNLPWTNGLGKQEAKCEVIGEEKITVPAGTFDTIKIECKGYWTRVFDGIGSDRLEEVYWYAPKVNRPVKSSWKNFRQGRLNDQQQSELTEYITK